MSQYITRNSNDDSLNELVTDILDVSSKKESLKDRVAEMIDEYVDSIANEAMQDAQMFAWVDNKTLRVKVCCGAGETVRDGLEDSLFVKEEDLDTLLADLDFTGLKESEQEGASLAAAVMLERHAQRIRAEARNGLET